MERAGRALSRYVNTDLKVLAKVMSLRLESMLPELMVPQQGAFVPGRSIQACRRAIAAAAGHCERLKRDGYLVDIDFSKAYDKVSHKYLWRVLEQRGMAGTPDSSVW